jgi:hypothetical protein
MAQDASITKRPSCQDMPGMLRKLIACSTWVGLRENLQESPHI